MEEKEIKVPMKIVEAIMEDVKERYPIIRGNVEMCRRIAGVHEQIEAVLTKHLEDYESLKSQLDEVRELLGKAYDKGFADGVNEGLGEWGSTKEDLEMAKTAVIKELIKGK